MSLVIDLDVRKVEIGGLEFNIKPMNQAAMNRFASLAQGKQKDVDVTDEKNIANILDNPETQELFRKIVPGHCELLTEFQVKEKGELRQGTIEDIMNLDVASLFRYKMGLITELMAGSNLTGEEIDDVKK